MFNSKNRVFNPYFLFGTCPMRKSLFSDNLRVEPTILLMEKISFSLKLFSGHFYGQSFIKTVRGPLVLKIVKGILITYYTYHLFCLAPNVCEFSHTFERGTFSHRKVP